MRWLIALLLIVLLSLQFKLWFGEGGVADVRRLEARVTEQVEKNMTLEARNTELRAEVEDLRERLEAVEERARSELGWIKEGEEFYQVVPAPESREKDNG